MTDNQELILDESAWQKIKDHVARNKGKYAALAGAALGAGLGYAAHKYGASPQSAPQLQPVQPTQAQPPTQPSQRSQQSNKNDFIDTSFGNFMKNVKLRNNVSSSTKTQKEPVVWKTQTSKMINNTDDF